MSELKHMLDVFPSQYCDCTETKYISGVDCPRCNGRGGFVDEVGRDEQIFIPCDMCEGTKHLKATITIEWEADYNFKKM